MMNEDVVTGDILGSTYLKTPQYHAQQAVIVQRSHVLLWLQSRSGNGRTPTAGYLLHKHYISERPPSQHSHFGLSYFHLFPPARPSQEANLGSSTLLPPYDLHTKKQEKNVSRIILQPEGSIKE